MSPVRDTAHGICCFGSSASQCGLAGPLAYSLLPRQQRDEGALAAQKILRLLQNYVPAHVGDGVGQRNPLGADFDAILGEAALLDAAVAGQGAEAVISEERRVGKE